jgi:hypothetical protein
MQAFILNYFSIKLYLNFFYRISIYYGIEIYFNVEKDNLNRIFIVLMPY